VMLRCKVLAPHHAGVVALHATVVASSDRRVMACDTGVAGFGGNGGYGAGACSCCHAVTTTENWHQQE